MTKARSQHCPMCGGCDLSHYHTDKVRDYWQCGRCDLVSVPPAQHLNSDDEKAYYDLHENLPDDPGYRKFLGRLFQPLDGQLARGAHGLDFGCGPGPALGRMFEEAGHSIALFDPYYAPNRTALSASYDFICLSEVAEHLAAPGRELNALWDCLRPGGWMGIMTKRVRDQAAFRTWHYITDPTHISYFSEATFHWLADDWSAKGPDAQLIIAGPDVVLMGKNP